MTHRKKLYMSIDEATPRHMGALVDGHNMGKWTIVPSPYNENRVESILVRGNRSLLTYEIKADSAQVSLPKYKRFCVSTSEGSRHASVLSLALMIRSHEKLFLQNAVGRSDNETFLGSLKYLYARAWVRHPLISLVILLWITIAWSILFIPSKPKFPTEQTTSSKLKPGSVVCKKIPGTNKVKC